jgi:hypothetical protein
MVIAGWKSDPRFCSTARRPKRLALDASAPHSFVALVKKYAGDVPHRAVLEELRELDAVNTDRNTIALKNSRKLHARKNFSFLSRALPLLTEGLALAEGHTQGRIAVAKVALHASSDDVLELAKSVCNTTAASSFYAGDELKQTSLHSFIVTIVVSRKKEKNRREVSD